MQISDAEWKVMNLIWESQPTAASDVIEQLADAHAWSAATIKTMLHRLVKKGALSATSSGKKYIYSCRVKRTDCVLHASRSFLDRVFGGDPAPALLHLVESSKLTPVQIDDLRKILDSMER